MRAYAAGLGLPFHHDSLLNARVDCGADRQPRAAALRGEGARAWSGRTPRPSLVSPPTRARCVGPRPASPDQPLYTCGAGVTGFTVDPYGALQLCQLSSAQLLRPAGGDLRRGVERSTSRSCARARWQTQALCRTCALVGLCGSCPGAAELEHGDPEAVVASFCEIAHARAFATLGDRGRASCRRHLLPGPRPRSKGVGNRGVRGWLWRVRTRARGRKGDGSHPRAARRPPRAVIVRLRVAGLTLSARADRDLEGLRPAPRLQPFTATRGGDIELLVCEEEPPEPSPGSRLFDSGWALEPPSARRPPALPVSRADRGTAALQGGADRRGKAPGHPLPSEAPTEPEDGLCPRFSPRRAALSASPRPGRRAFRPRLRGASPGGSGALLWRVRRRQDHPGPGVPPRGGERTERRPRGPASDSARV